MLKIGVMGAIGSFSEAAGEWYATEAKLTEYRLVPLVTAENVLRTLTDGTIDLAVFPIVNNNGGVVMEALYASARHTFVVETTFKMDIRQTLLGWPGVDRSSITTICSHIQALTQCEGYLERVWPGIATTEYADTALAAADLAAGTLPKTTAIIGAERAAVVYDLDVLDRDIQDAKVNQTTFVVATKRK